MAGGKPARTADNHPEISRKDERQNPQKESKPTRMPDTREFSVSAATQQIAVPPPGLVREGEMQGARKRQDRRAYSIRKSLPFPQQRSRSPSYLPGWFGMVRCKAQGNGRIDAYIQYARVCRFRSNTADRRPTSRAGSGWGDARRKKTAGSTRIFNTRESAVSAATQQIAVPNQPGRLRMGTGGGKELFHGYAIHRDRIEHSGPGRG